MKLKITYWISLSLFCLMMTGSALAYLLGAEQMVGAFRHLGYPDYFRSLLGVAKLLGVAALLLPAVPAILREWAYAGFFITLVAGALSHAVSGDPLGHVINPLFTLSLLLVARFLAGRVRGHCHGAKPSNVS